MTFSGNSRRVVHDFAQAQTPPTPASYGDDETAAASEFTANEVLVVERLDERGPESDSVVGGDSPQILDASIGKFGDEFHSLIEE